MGLKAAECLGQLSDAIRQDTAHQAAVVVVQNRYRHPAEKGEGSVVAVQPSFRRRRRVRHHKARVAVRQVHGKKMRPLSDTADDHIGFAKVRLRITRWM